MVIPAALVPELYVDDLEQSLRFYASMGFTVRYARPEERFAMIAQGAAQIMLEEPVGRVFGEVGSSGARGHGLNLQITVTDADDLRSRVPRGSLIPLDVETRSYAAGDEELTVRQFIVADPDGYLLRFSSVLSVTPARPAANP